MTTTAAKDFPVTEPFLAVEGEKDEGGRRVMDLRAILGPAVLWVLMDPRHPVGGTGNQRWQFVKLDGRAWRFKCPCGDSTCTLTMTLKAAYHGRHPTRE